MRGMETNYAGSAQRTRPLTLHRRLYTAILAIVSRLDGEGEGRPAVNTDLQGCSAAWEWLVARGGVRLLFLPVNPDPPRSVRVTFPHRSVGPRLPTRRNVSHAQIASMTSGGPRLQTWGNDSHPQIVSPISEEMGHPSVGSAVRTASVQSTQNVIRLSARRVRCVDLKGSIDTKRNPVIKFNYLGGEP